VGVVEGRVLFRCFWFDFLCRETPRHRPLILPHPFSPPWCFFLSPQLVFFFFFFFYSLPCFDYILAAVGWPPFAPPPPVPPGFIFLCQLLEVREGGVNEWYMTTPCPLFFFFFFWSWANRCLLFLLRVVSPPLVKVPPQVLFPLQSSSGFCSSFFGFSFFLFLCFQSIGRGNLFFFFFFPSLPARCIMSPVKDSHSPQNYV